MRFYDPNETPPTRLDSAKLFPLCTEEQAAKRCLTLGLLPSVTTVLKIIREEYLESWLMREALKAGRKDTLSNPADIVHNLQTKDSPNSKFGTSVHDIVDHWFKNKPIGAVDPQALAHAQPLLNWLKKNVSQKILAEETIACTKLGAAGTIDMVFTDNQNNFIVGDIKVVKFSDKFPPKPSLAYKMQLSAYSKLLQNANKAPEKIIRKSFYLASPFGWNSRPALKVFPHEKCYLGAFQAALTLWKENILQEYPEAA